MSDPTEQVAEAIHDADYTAAWPWKYTANDRKRYRIMARAAIDALQLTREWGIAFTDSLDGQPDSVEIVGEEPSAEIKGLAAKYPGRCIVSHLVAPWAEERP